MVPPEIRELRYFVAVAEERNLGRAAERLHVSQPPLSRAMRQLEQRLGVALLERHSRGVALTRAGEVLLAESRTILDATAAAVRRTQRAASIARRVRLVTKAGANHDLLRTLSDASGANEYAPPIEVIFCAIGKQTRLVRDGVADVALVHRSHAELTGCESLDLRTEGQIAVLPAEHPLASRTSVTFEDVTDVPDLPMARWPLLDGSYLPGRGPEIHDQAQLAEIIALGEALAVLPESGRAWLWGGHTAVPIIDAPRMTTALAWLPRSRPLLDELIVTAQSLARSGLLAPIGEPLFERPLQPPTRDTSDTEVVLGSKSSGDPARLRPHPAR